MKTFPTPIRARRLNANLWRLAAGMAIRAWRDSQNPRVKQQTLAARVPTTAATLSRIEAGKQAISEAMLPRFMTLTGIPAGVLRPDLAHLFNAPKAARRRRAA